MSTQNKPLTTGEVAAYCGVSRVGVLRWIKAGRLRAYRTPGGHYRITPHDFKAFLTDTGFIKTESESPQKPKKLKRVLIVTKNSAVLGNVIHLLSDMPTRLEMDVAMEQSVAVAKLIVFHPHIVIFDDTVGGCNVLQFASKAKEIAQQQGLLPILLLANTTIATSEISRLTSSFSLVAIEPRLPATPNDSASQRLKSVVEELLSG